ncbi:flagellar assembly protein FliW [Alkaliphilus peptidifermentans]|uniref:Flagellar assembly factor FliW n=1 Tax=Alkaliphilus peptidifermentans DSM 18978 TaxID=1120976 RepID=A0A1G5JFB5_9FIRM|nr:flagellar assembly protein FliW [Alkaliphilus peptidifermentans]SCY86854.1 flagellar assembly factor FliW [Alkaliphilus peptidifermentans DSM 18978]
MIIETRHFGEIEVGLEEVIHFPDGIPAFEENKKYVIIENPDKDVPFHWLQSIEEPSLAFVIINPFLFMEDYDFQIPKSILEKLEIESPEIVSVHTIVVVPDDINKMTANLKAPIIINTKNKKGKQIVLDDTKYQTKHYIIDEIKKTG